MQSKPNIYFVTGTDTGIGKTVVTAALVAALRAQGVNAWPAKPVQTGCETDDDIGWILDHLDDGGSVPERDVLTCYRFPLPASPHLAAREAGETVSLKRIVDWAEKLAANCDVLITEGAGGLLVPLNDNETMFDLMFALNAQPILVTANRLGTLNHTALTLQEMMRRGFPPVLIIINELEPSADSRIRNDNARQITTMAGNIPTIQCASFIDLPSNEMTAFRKRALDSMSS